MNCPKCTTPTLDPRTLNGIEVDQCPACRGVWFDAAELGRLLKLAAADLKPLTRGSGDDALNAKPANCPRDGTRLVRVCSAQNRAVVVDTCAVCRGVWLDGGELARLLPQ